jgi:hypothetical protein
MLHPTLTTRSAITVPFQSGRRRRVAALKACDKWSAALSSVGDIPVALDPEQRDPSTTPRAARAQFAEGLQRVTHIHRG